MKEEDDNLLSGLGYEPYMKLRRSSLACGLSWYLSQGGPLTSGRTACTLQSAVALLRHDGSWDSRIHVM